MKKGKFFGVGIGPGCPDLITVKGSRLIAEADVIYVPTKNGITSSVAYKTIKPYLKSAEIKPAKFSMSYKPEVLEEYRSKIICEIKDDLISGKNVVFVTLGDPMLYSTYIYILNGLKKSLENFDFETVPGITSFSALAAKSSVPLVEENEVLTVYPVTHFSKENFETLYEKSDSMILMKIPKKSKEIMDVVKSKDFSEIVHMKNICLSDEELNLDINSKELSDNTQKKYLSIILLKK